MCHEMNKSNLKNQTIEFVNITLTSERVAIKIKNTLLMNGLHLNVDLSKK